MEVIVPAAGLSSRFPNMRPKYSLVDHSGKTMLELALADYIDKYHITIGILQEHQNQYDVIGLLKHRFKDKINIVVLDKLTSGPADTVYQIIKKANIDLEKEILIKDCDSFFNHKYLPGNYVCFSSFSDNELIRKPSSKSYIISNEQGIINNIIEKQVISDKFCVGGYKFQSAKLFTEAFENISKDNSNEIYVSNVIQYCLFNNHIFIENKVSNYIDVGTAEEWFNYNDKAVIFCDIDGTLIKAQSKHDYDKPPIVLENNVKSVKKMVDDGSQIIFVTARAESARTVTENMLKNLGFNSFQLLMGLKNCKRILINDFNNANPYPRAIAVNIKRDKDNLKQYIDSL